MPVIINASTSAGAQIIPDNSGVLQFQSNGANTVAIAANGTMTTPAGIVVATASGSAAGGLIRAPQVLTSGTSYTTPATCTSIYVEAVGGGGGGAWSANAQVDGGGGGGGAGAYCAKYFTVTGNTSYTYAIGAGGAANGATGSGGSAAVAGGNTTFTVGNVTITAGGGAVGQYTSGTNGADGGIGGTATNGDINARGGSGSTGTATLDSASALSTGGAGGSSFFGGNGAGGDDGSNAITIGANGVLGGGGGGRSGSTAGPTAAQLPGYGGNGIIRIWEFT